MLILSEPTDQFRLGNLLPDLLPPAELGALPDDFQRGAACHRRIDAFTDRHPLVRRSILRLGPDYRRFGGIVIDVFYDHFLVLDWERHSQNALPEFVRSVYAAVEAQRGHLPPQVLVPLERMAAEDWLSKYGEVDGIRRTLDRIGLRFRKPQSLGGAISSLIDQADDLRQDFRQFFPELKIHIAQTGYEDRQVVAPGSQS